jgi:hypothetical protein
MDAIKAVIGELQDAEDSPHGPGLDRSVPPGARSARTHTRRRCRSHIAGLLVPKQHHGALVYLDR